MKKKFNKSEDIFMYLDFVKKVEVGSKMPCFNRNPHPAL